VTLDLDLTRIQVDALGHTPTPFWSVLSCHLCFLPGDSHPEEVLVDCAPAVCTRTTWTLNLSWTPEPPSTTPVDALMIHEYHMSKPCSGVFIHLVLPEIHYTRFPVTSTWQGSCQLVNKSSNGIWETTQQTQRTFARANWLRTCYGETGAMDFGLMSSILCCPICFISSVLATPLTWSAVIGRRRKRRRRRRC